MNFWKKLEHVMLGLKFRHFQQWVKSEYWLTEAIVGFDITSCVDFNVNTELKEVLSFMVF